MQGKPTRWTIKTWVIADGNNEYLLKCKIYLRKREKKMKIFYWESK
jgi:hypothetical protein